jgi:ABC-2 type transport system permease protein
MVDEAVGRERTGVGDEVTTWAQARRGWVQEVMALARRWYLQLIRDRLNLIFSLLQPAIWLAFFGSAMGRAIDSEVIGTSDYIGFMLPGVIAFTVVTNAMTGAMPLLWDKEVGYLDKLLAKPIARSSLIVSRFVFQFGLGSAQVVLVFVVAVAVTVDIASGPLGALMILAIAGLLSMSFTALFMALAYRVPTHGTFFAVSGFVSLPLVFLSNAFVPTDAMPDWMRWIAQINPLTYAIEAMRNLVLEGWTGEMAGALLVLTGFAAASLALATYEFTRHTGERVR